MLNKSIKYQIITSLLIFISFPILYIGAHKNINALSYIGISIIVISMLSTTIKRLVKK